MNYVRFPSLKRQMQDDNGIFMKRLSKMIVPLIGNMNDKARLLESAFLLGAATDAAALLPMLDSEWARRVWGFDQLNANYRFAMRMGASLMAAWTVLLLWAAQAPIERRAVAPMTVLIIAGFVGTETRAVAVGDMELAKAAPSLAMQALLSTMFLLGYLKAQPENISSSC